MGDILLNLQGYHYNFEYFPIACKSSKSCAQVNPSIQFKVIKIISYVELSKNMSFSSELQNCPYRTREINNISIFSDLSQTINAP